MTAVVDIYSEIYVIHSTCKFLYIQSNNKAAAAVVVVVTISSYNYREKSWGPE